MNENKPVPMTRKVDPAVDKGKTVIITSTGERALLIGADVSPTGAERGAFVSTAFSRHMYGWRPLSDLELATPKPKGRGYDLKEDFGAIMDGLIEVPNWKVEENQGHALCNLTLGGLYTPPGSGNILLPEAPGTKWAKFFLRQTQGGGFDGRGWAIVYQSAGGIIGKFAICEHVVRSGEGANPRRGWHPASCEKCGIDLSVDSGD